ncbi:MAG: peptide deformylase [Candidatus Acidiferrum sp.]
MPNKSTSSKPLPSAASGAQETATVAAPETPAKPVKIYPIVKYGDPILEKPGAPIKKFDAEMERLVEDMFASMYAAQGVGLAAPQIGLGLRITVIDVTGGKNPEAKIVLANPEIIHAEGEVREEEGCLSIPGFRGYVIRPQFVTVKAQNAKGESYEIRGENLLARAFCHEIDHLNGILFLQHLSMLKRDLIKRKIKKLRKQGEW